MLYSLKLKSDNSKTGPIPVSITESKSCPPSCGQYTTCYAKGGPLSMAWRKLENKGVGIGDLCAMIKAMPYGQLWRHNQAGDLPGVGERINATELRAIVAANRGKRGFTFTHKPMTARNAQLVKEANDGGFTVNLSADTVKQADEYRAMGIGPVVMVVPKNTVKPFRTPGGHRVILCPAVTHSVTCERCKLCAWGGREVIVGFPAHGVKKNSIKSSGMFPILGQ